MEELQKFFKSLLLDGNVKYSEEKNSLKSIRVWKINEGKKRMPGKPNGVRDYLEKVKVEISLCALRINCTHFALRKRHVLEMSGQSKKVDRIKSEIIQSLNVNLSTKHRSSIEGSR